MPKFVCKCENIISVNEIPNPNEWLTISDVEYDRYSGVINSEELYKDMKIILKCNKCERLHCFWDGFDKPPVTYSKD